MRFSEFFGLRKSQAELDFIDIDPDWDTRLFIDPYAIEIRDDELSSELGYHVVSFFEDVLKSLADNPDRAVDLTNNLSEPQETFLGMSKGQPQGRGWGAFQSGQLLDALRNSRAFQTGILQDVAESELFIDGIGPDKISDLTTNLIRGPLIKYTKQQCEMYGIALNPGLAIAPIWDPDRRIWISEYQALPVVEGKPVILVPKIIARRRISLNSQEYYNLTVLEHLRAEHLSANTGLVRVLKSKKRYGEKVVWKKDLREEHPFSKGFLAEITRANPRLLEFYKELKGAQGAMSAKDLDPTLDESALASELKERLARIPLGKEAASEYQDCAASIFIFLFYPHLVSPKLEAPIHEGRKRIDIIFTNWSESGFFSSIKTAPQTRARYIIIECKNYSDDLENPEFDQLTGRFSPMRGQFGIISCREINKRESALRRCKDAAVDNRGVVILLEDSDLQTMLDFVANRQRANISRYMEDKLRSVIL
jgi:hypothetical protein